MDKQPFATIIVPTYNQEAFLGQALDSLLAQTDPDWEAIVVNDGSTDRTAKIAEEYSRRDSRIRCLHKPNGGVASALNAGLENARGRWIHWLSSDDIFESDKLAINRRWIERHPDHDFFFSYFTLLREATGAKERRELWGPLPDPEHQILTLFFRNYVSGISICVKREAWTEAGFFDESLYYAQDYDRWLRLLQKNQGMFIPEWTVISRNHAAQGSETFPDACYFDTAKAAIRFLNEHTFPELVPWADLADQETAVKAVVHALDVACDRTAFVYCLGPHPALVLRLLEWAFSEGNIDPALITLIRSRISEMSLQEGADDWAWMWRRLAVAAHGQGGDFTYSPIDPVQVALAEYQARRVGDGSSHVPLREYLARFEKRDVDAESTIEGKGARIAFLIDRPVEIAPLLTATDRLARHGYRPVVLITDRSTGGAAWRWHGCVPAIHVSALDRDTLPWLGDVELAVALAGCEISVWLGALSQLILADGLSAEDIEQNVMAALGQGVQQPVRRVVFLERVLWGGGAERVVFDIVRHMDRRRYRPVILTMFDEHTPAPKLPPDVDVYNVRHELFGRRASVEESSAKAAPDTRETPETGGRWERRLRHVYHRLLPPDIRRRIGFGHLLLSIKQTPVSDPATRNHMALASRPEQCVTHGIEANVSLDFDYINAMAHHNPAAVGLAKVMDKLGNDTVLVSIMEEAAVTAWLAQAHLSFPYIVSLHIFESIYLPKIFPCHARLLAERRLLSAACNDAGMVVFPSDGCCKDLETNFRVSKTEVRRIWNPVDCSRVHRMSFQRIDAVERWQASATSFRMVHVGRLDQQKNHELLLAVCAELKGRHRQFSLAIVGEGQERANIEKQIDALGLNGLVMLVGEQKNPFPWIAAADTLLLTSHFEAFALVLVEAMACGTPVVSVDCPAGPAEVLNNGEFGLLVPNDDPLALADMVERLMDDSLLAQRMSELGYERARAFDVKNIVPQWEALLDALPHGRG